MNDDVFLSFVRSFFLSFVLSFFLAEKKKKWIEESLSRKRLFVCFDCMVDKHFKTSTLLFVFPFVKKFELY